MNSAARAERSLPGRRLINTPTPEFPTDVLSEIAVTWIKSQWRAPDHPAHLIIYGRGEEVLWETYVDDDGVQPPHGRSIR